MHILSHKKTYITKHNYNVKLKIKYHVRIYNYKNCAEKFPARAQDEKKHRRWNEKYR